MSSDAIGPPPERPGHAPKWAGSWNSRRLYRVPTDDVDGPLRVLAVDAVPGPGARVVAIAAGRWHTVSEPPSFAGPGEFFASLDISIERVMTGNHWSYTTTTTVADVIAELGASRKRIRPHCPWRKRQDRTLQPHRPGRVGRPTSLRLQQRAIRRSARVPPPLQQ
jgi:hypothetical protein